MNDEYIRWANTHLCDKSCPNLSSGRCLFYNCALKHFDKDNGRYYVCAKCQNDTYMKTGEEEYDN